MIQEIFHLETLSEPCQIAELAWMHLKTGGSTLYHFVLYCLVLFGRNF